MLSEVCGSFVEVEMQRPAQSSELTASTTTSTEDSSIESAEEFASFEDKAVIPEESTIKHSEMIVFKDYRLLPEKVPTKALQKFSINEDYFTRRSRSISQSFVMISTAAAA